MESLPLLLSCFPQLPAGSDVTSRCLARHRAPGLPAFTTSTAQLSRCLRVLKGAAPADRRLAVEEAFMTLVTKVREQAGGEVWRRVSSACRVAPYHSRTWCDEGLHSTCDVAPYHPSARRGPVAHARTAALHHNTRMLP